MEISSIRTRAANITIHLKEYAVTAVHFSVCTAFNSTSHSLCAIAVEQTVSTIKALSKQHKERVYFSVAIGETFSHRCDNRINSRHKDRERQRNTERRWACCSWFLLTVKCIFSGALDVHVSLCFLFLWRATSQRGRKHAGCGRIFSFCIFRPGIQSEERNFARLREYTVKLVITWEIDGRARFWKLERGTVLQEEKWRRLLWPF